MILFYGIFMLTLVLSGASYLVLKYYGYKKTGIIVSLLLVCILLIPIFSIVFESQLYFKNDVRKDLKSAGIVLKDDFEIEENDITGLSDYYQLTKLKISTADRDNIISLVKNAKDFKTMAELQYHYKDTLRDEKNVKFVWYYNVMDNFIIETYERKERHIPMELMLSVNRHSNDLDLNITRD